MPKKLLEDKVTIVTGGASGIGRASALLFSKHGAHVIVANRRVEKGKETVSIIQNNGGSAEFIQTDIANEHHVTSLIDTAMHEHNRIDCAFNCAGYEGMRAPLIKTDTSHWSEIFDTNTKGTFLLLKHEIPAMAATGGGTIVNMSSISGLIGRPGRSAYNASRAAIINLTKTAALESIRSGVRINAVGPGATRTDIFSHMTDGLRKEKVEQYEKLHPIGRIAEPSEIAEASLWLLSELSSFVVGHTLMVDGGLSAGVAG